MAEQVQSILESMVPHLKDLRSRGLFSPDEIHSIVDRRRQSEYLLQRRSAARKSDYLRYIEDEILLERLRKLRKEKVLTDLRNERYRRYEEGGGGSDSEEDSDDGNKKKHAYKASGPGDSHIISHIHFLYQRTLRKFHYPIDIILNYAQFAKDVKSFGMLGRIYAEGLQHHPREEGLWIEAASFEYFGYVAQDYETGGNDEEINSKVVGSSIQNARVLMQRGLRINGKTSKDLWLQYFALELHYVQKLRGRREILELGLKNTADEDEGDMSSADEDEVSSSSEGDNEKKIKKIPTNLLPSQIIFKNAIKAIPSDVQFRLRFIETCRMFPQTLGLEGYIMDSVTEAFGTNVMGWVARISYADEEYRRKGTSKMNHEIAAAVGFLGKAADENEAEDSSNESSDDSEQEDRPAKKARRVEPGDDPALDLLQQALEAVPTPQMYLESARFLRLRIQRLLEHEEQVEGEDDVSYLIGKHENAKLAAQRHAHLLEELYDDAKVKNVSSINLILDHVDFLLSTGQPTKAEKILSNAAEDRGSSNNPRLWLRWAEISTRMEGASMKPSLQATRILRKAIKATPIHDRQAHTLILTKLMHHVMMQPPSLKTKEELKSLFQKLLLLSQGMSSVKPSVSKDRAEDNDDEEEGELEEVNVASTFLAYLKYTILNNRAGDEDDVGGMSSVRSIYTNILYHSNYGKSCMGKMDQELITMKSFFDLCIQYEHNAKSSESKSTKKKDRKVSSKMILCKLYEKAIGFYEGGSGDGFLRAVADEYRRALQDIKCRF